MWKIYPSELSSWNYWSVARVTPIYKRGSKSDIDNYNLHQSSLSKILEEHVCKHFIVFNLTMIYCTNANRVLELTTSAKPSSSKLQMNDLKQWCGYDRSKEPKPRTEAMRRTFFYSSIKELNVLNLKPTTSFSLMNTTLTNTAAFKPYGLNWFSCLLTIHIRFNKSHFFKSP